MELTHLTVHNYRSIRHLDLACHSLVTLLGPNNHGKSNILSALDFGLSTSAKPTQEDLFVYRDEDEFWVELTFGSLTLQEQTTFRRYVRSDGTVCVRKTCRNDAGHLDTSYHGYIEEPQEEWLQADNAGTYTTRERISTTPLRDLVPSAGRLTKNHIEEAQQQYIQLHRENLRFSNTLEQGAFLGQKNIGGGVLPDFYLIPAIRDLTDEIKVKSTTTFGRLLTRAISEMTERDPRFREVREGLEQVVASLNTREVSGADSQNALEVLENVIEEELGSWGVDISIEVSPPDIGRLFELGTDLYLDDGVKTSAARKGHGLQRAVIFALLRSWARLLHSTAPEKTRTTPRKESESVIFAIEEPELFLHPHAQRRLAGSLREIADTPQHQVLVCTHSTHFVDLNHYQEIAIASRDNPRAGTTIRQCNRELFEGPDVADRKNRFHMAQWVNPDRAELFFARRVVFVEGETEKVILPYLATRLGLLDAEVSIIDCGSKSNLPLYIEIAKAFGIPYVVIHDEDPVPDPVPAEWSKDRRVAREKMFALNAEIRERVEAPLGVSGVLAPDFEHVAGIPLSQGQKKGKALAALDHFASVSVAEIPELLQAVVRTAYAVE